MNQPKKILCNSTMMKQMIYNLNFLTIKKTKSIIIVNNPPLNYKTLSAETAIKQESHMNTSIFEEAKLFQSKTKKKGAPKGKQAIQELET